jgi:hypothetical protein
VYGHNWEIERAFIIRRPIVGRSCLNGTGLISRAGSGGGKISFVAAAAAAIVG